MEFPIHRTRIAVTNAAKEIIGSKEIRYEADAEADEVLQGLINEIEEIVKKLASVWKRYWG